MPSPIFDIQITADFSGAKYYIMYEKLVSQYLQFSINKNMQVLNCEILPLTISQLQYSLFRIIYLRTLFPIMRDQSQTRFEVSQYLSNNI